MRAREFITKEIPSLLESRGVTARSPGERYINNSDKNDFRVIQNVTAISPENKAAFDTAQELQDVLTKIIPAGKNTIEDNKMTSDTRAAIVATVSTSDDQTEYWVRYIKAVPATGLHGLWKTLRGFSYDHPRSHSEKIKIKPSDLIVDQSPRTLEQLVAQIQQSINAIGDEQLDDIMTQAVTQAAEGKPLVIKNGAKYSAAIAKYAGEYLGVLELMSGRMLGGDLARAMDALEVKTFRGSTVVFPQDTRQELYDSVLTTADGKVIRISTKMDQGGSSSSLSGVVSQISPEIEQRYPNGSRILKILGTKLGVDSVLDTAVDYKVITKEDADEVRVLDKSSKDPNIIKSPALRAILAAQKIRPGSYQRMGYTIRRHLMAALANKTIATLNQDPEVLDALRDALNNNSYLQMVTSARVAGQDLQVDFYTKFPAEFRGKPKLVNSAFWSTGEQGRITFILP